MPIIKKWKWHLTPNRSGKNGAAPSSSVNYSDGAIIRITALMIVGKSEKYACIDSILIPLQISNDV